MLELSATDIQKALGRLDDGVKRYQWLQANVLTCNVSTHRDFQRRFDAFYRVRRGAEWRAAFFNLMEDSKGNGIDFAQALRSLNGSTGRLEASFASKLVATLDPSTPVIDKFVLDNFDLRLPYWGAADREERTIEVYQQLCLKCCGLMTSPIGVMIRTMFDSKYPGTNVTDLKKIDLVLWQNR